MSLSFHTRSIQKPCTAEHRIYIEHNEKIVSPFHDIPLFANAEKTILNMIVEIPRWCNAKLEIATKEPMNPLKQDTKKGQLRFVRNCFPYKGYIWNYGAFPQTWEDPTAIYEATGSRGDNDPLDVCEIGSGIGYPGQVKQVKVLGVLCLIDDGETDWKVLAIDVNDPRANNLHDLNDIDRHFPGLISATRHWFEIYKIPDGKPANRFAFNGQCKDKAFALDVIEETHQAWHRLIEGKKALDKVTGDLSLTNVNVATSPYRIDRWLHNNSEETEVQRSTSKEERGDGKTPSAVEDNRWYFVKPRL